MRRYNRHFKLAHVLSSSKFNNVLGLNAFAPRLVTYFQVYKSMLRVSVVTYTWVAFNQALAQAHPRMVQHLTIK